MSLAITHRESLRRLARGHGVALSYTAQGGRRVRTSTEATIATLQALGVPVTAEADAAQLLAAAQAERQAQPLEPVLVVDRSGGVSSPVTVPVETDLAAARVSVVMADGGTVDYPLSILVTGRRRVEGREDLMALGLNLASLALPVGYHELRIDGLNRPASALLLVPPTAAALTSRDYGVFAPVYGLRGDSDWGVGTFSDLAALADGAGELGASLVGTLPMFPIFFDPPVDPSPYLPVSRLFVNELFIDVAALPEVQRSDRARELIGTTDFQQATAELSSRPQVDYGEVMRRKRAVLELCADELFDGSGSRRGDYQAYLARHPELEGYADFRAAAETLGTSWLDWPTSDRTVPAGAVGVDARRYHLYAQFAAGEQLAAVADGGSPSRAGLYLDLPVGVHPDGYDTWSQPLAFAPATVGAPPDRLAPQGQAWGFPPLHPGRIRADRYRYVIDCYRHLFVHARTVRIDHALGLQRMFWIAPGAAAESGAYVRYRAEELFAILTIEAARAGAVVVGEDLGTVPAGIRRAMDRNAILHSFVYQFDASAAHPFPQPATPSMATLGSHDLPRFAGFWRGLDIDDRVDRGVTGAAEAAREHVDRAALAATVAGCIGDDTVASAFAACIDSLAAGPAPCVMVDLADIEGETEPDNRPGTGPEADNWRWRLRRPLGQILGDPVVQTRLRGVGDRRQGREEVTPSSPDSGRAGAGSSDTEDVTT